MLLALWLVAERWGTVGPHGVLIRVPLSHKLLAMLIGCRRPSVTVALGKLSAAGLLARPARQQIMLTRAGLDALVDSEQVVVPISRSGAG